MINCIVAVEEGHGIGNNGFMPWPKLKGDMDWFRSTTVGHVVIMGSVTWASLKKPLSNRINIVLSKTKLCSGADHIFSDIDTAIEFCYQEYPDKEIFIIGGDSIYQQSMHFVDKWFITEIESKFPCDRFFNLEYVKNNFRTVTEIAKYSDPLPYKIKEYTR